MFKIIKRRKGKTDAGEAAVSSAPGAPDVTVNHASRIADAVAHHASRVSEVPQLVCLANAPADPSVVEVLPLLKDVPASERHALFVRKLQICCVHFDFIDVMKYAREKEIKRQTVTELIDLVHTGSCKMNDQMQEDLVKMISINIFRSLPPASYECTGGQSGDPEEDDLFLDPGWAHMQLVYELLLRYVLSSDMDTRVAKRFLDHAFLVKFLDLFETEDLREREYLKSILHCIYGKFMVHRPFIRKAINNILYRFIFETERHNGIGELLEIIGSIINGLALPMREEHKLFLVRALIPLHKLKCVTDYHHHLSYCTSLFVEKDYRFSCVVIKGLLKYWPVSNCGKEVLFIGELEEILECTHPAEFQRCMVPLFVQIGRSLNSPNFQVAERALFLWNNEHIVELIALYRHVILPIIFTPLERNMQDHWNQAVHGLTSNVQRMFQEMDTELFEECQRKFEETEASAEAVEEQRKQTWKRIESAAKARRGVKTEPDCSKVSAF
ncbi:PREDICTED: serine/threonine protein phosphatase 2A 57 kDa regulatory subunit B' beta isoform-like [Ipomoea nil]|uniref:serine/threonine protein phosphatase 2A 57 kDa regulatory subunit B' beta isoform-like n=1 Tax=Ipomoea nil TaxID=35883 RepID=UPI0009011ABF|nr:PREDICTED: serine/threonine protein phosphatase 2A 57 kDa regulatory subunit B' beta isoform-like [Ipomoea nil]